MKQKIIIVIFLAVIMAATAFAANPTKNPLAQSTNGMCIKIAATSTPGTAVDTAVTGTTAGTWDEEWIWLYNSNTVAETCTIEFGDATAPDHNIVLSVPAQSGLVPAVPGLILDNGKTIGIFCTDANKVTACGFKNSMATP